MVTLPDTVILSARPIPGNERMIGSLIDALLSRGATVFHGSANPGVHVSGHATAPQQRQMIQTVRPKHFIPIHGELRQLYRHLQVARDTGVIPNEGLLLARDGEVLEFADGLGRHAGDGAELRNEMSLIVIAGHGRDPGPARSTIGRRAQRAMEPSELRVGLRPESHGFAEDASEMALAHAEIGRDGTNVRVRESLDRG